MFVVTLDIIIEESKNETADYQNHNIQPHDGDRCMGCCASPRKNLVSNHSNINLILPILCLLLNTNSIVMTPPFYTEQDRHHKHEHPQDYPTISSLPIKLLTIYYILPRVSVDWYMNQHNGGSAQLCQKCALSRVKYVYFSSPFAAHVRAQPVQTHFREPK